MYNKCLCVAWMPHSISIVFGVMAFKKKFCPRTIELFHRFGTNLCRQKWNGMMKVVLPFHFFIGTPQGNILTLKLFNISIGDLLLELQDCSYDLKSDGRNPNYFAYA